MLKWARAAGCPWDHTACWWAARHGFAEILHWARSQGCKVSGLRAGRHSPRDHRGRCLLSPVHGEYGPWDTNICEAAAQGGHFEMLKEVEAWTPPYAISGSMGSYGSASVRQVDSYICEAAAEAGHLPMMRWLVEEKDCRLNSKVWVAAARSGRTELLEYLWLQAGPCNHEYSNQSVSAAAAAGHVSAMEYLQRKGFLASDSAWKDLVIAASGHGQSALLSWASLHGPGGIEIAHGPEQCDAAAMHGELEMLRWLRGRGCEWGTLVCTNAAKNAHLHILKFAREQGCPWRGAGTSQGSAVVGCWGHARGGGGGALVCAAAAGNGELETLRWLRLHGCPWDCSTVEAAARYV